MIVDFSVSRRGFRDGIPVLRMRYDVDISMIPTALFSQAVQLERILMLI